MFEIETKSGKKINLTTELLIQKLLQNIVEDKDNPKLKSSNEFIQEIHKNLNTNFLNATNLQTYEIYFLAGYYYQVFLRKNNVKEKEENV